MIYKMTLKDSVDTMTFNLLETPIVDKDIEGAVDNVTLDGNQYTDYLYLKKQYIQKWAIMCPDEYDELRGFYTRQFEDGEVPSYRVYYGANVTRDYTFNGDYFQFNAEGIETGMTLSQLFGNAEQTTYSGKNLLNIDFTSTTTAGITITNNGDGTITVSGTTTGAIGYNLSPSATNQQNPLALAPNTAYTQRLEILSGSASNFSVVPAFKDSGGTVHYNFFSNNQTTTTTDTMTCTYYNIYWGAAGRVINATFRVWLEKGSDLASSFEPYVGGTPAPNPDFPQPISTVTGAQNIEVVGKNLFDKDSATQNYRLSSTGEPFGDNDYYLSDFISVRQSTAYYISGVSGNAESSAVCFYASDKSFISRRAFVSDWYSFTTPANTVFLRFATLKTHSIDQVQLEEGSTATAYEPYQGQNYEINLGKNLFDVSNTNTLALGTNTLVTSAAYRGYTLKATPGATYTLSRASTSTPPRFRVCFTKELPAVGVSYYDQYGSLGVSINADSLTATTFTVPSDMVYIFIYLSNNGTLIDESMKIQLERGSQATSYAPYFTPIELAKIGTYQDRIYKEDSKWYIEKRIGKLNMADIRWDGLNGAGNPYHIGFVTNYGAENTTTISNIFTYSATAWAGNGKFGIASSGSLWMMTGDSTVDASNAPSWLANKNAIMYYALATPTTTEITDETLLYQLNFLASLYKGANNISLVGTWVQGEMEVFIRDVMSVETDVVPEVPVRLTLTDDGVINACGCRRNVQLTMRETTE